MRTYILRGYSPSVLLHNGNNNATDVRKSLDVLAGLCLGILADGEINSKEARFLKAWLEHNNHLLPTQIFSRLFRILGQLASDQDASEIELCELSKMLFSTLGFEPGMNFESASLNAQNFNRPCGLIFDVIDTDTFSIDNAEIVVTGELENLKRSEILDKIFQHGGVPRDGNPTIKTRVVVVGSKGSSRWSSSNLGSKIKHALLLKENGQAISIVRESDFLQYIESLQKCASLPNLADVSEIQANRQDACAESVQATDVTASALPLSGKTFVITGTLSRDRDEIKAQIEAYGGKVSGSVSSKTSYVLAGEGGGSKAEKATQLNIPIISEVTFLAMLPP